MERLFVISDLHLGGAPADGRRHSFQMCGPLGQERLAEFVAWASEQKTPSRDVHLVINGDIVDFLAERGADRSFLPFTGDEDAAVAKLDAIVGRTTPIWEALRELCAGGAALTLLVGNHDVELSLPRVRRALLDRIGPGRVDFVYDNQALAIGPVLIEHGNRYDRWNGIAHDALRQVRSALSRGEAAPTLEPPPGSRLVVEVMNHLKEQYSFIDLLKPEDSVLLPFIALLDRNLWRHGKALATQWHKARQRQLDPDGRPADPAYIAAQEEHDDAMIRLADDIAAGGSAANAAASADPEPRFRDRWAKITTAIAQAADEMGRVAAEAKQRAELELLYRALRPFAEQSRRTFAVDQESADYLGSARARRKAGFELVVYGHTHLAKDVTLEDVGVRYLNTGTWADLLRVPDVIFGRDTAEARSKLREFADALASNRIERFRRNVPTFARIDLDQGAIVDAGVHFFLGRGATEPVTTERLLALLDAEEPGG